MAHINVQNREEEGGWHRNTQTHTFTMSETQHKSSRAPNNRRTSCSLVTYKRFVVFEHDVFKLAVIEQIELDIHYSFFIAVSGIAV